MKSYQCKSKSKSKSPKHDCNYHFETRELLLEMESPELMEANALQRHISASHIHSQRETVLTSTASWWVLVATWAKRRINPLSIETSPRVLAKQGSQCIYVTTFVNSIYSSTKEIHMNNLKLNLCQWSKKKRPWRSRNVVSGIFRNNRGLCLGIEFFMDKWQGSS